MAVDPIWCRSSCVLAWVWGAAFGGRIVRENAVHAVRSESLPIESTARIIGHIQGRPAEWVREDIEEET